MSKRILSMILTLTLVLGTMGTAFAAVPEDVIGTDVEDAVTRLGNLGILEGYEDGTFKPDNKIKRSEFAAVVVRARGLEKAAQNSKGVTVFDDVPATEWFSGYANVADDANLIKGMGVIDGKNYFRPDRTITYEQAVTLVVRALGYEPAAQANGGYPNGHLIVASQEGLLDGISGVQGQEATRGLVAQLTDNALEVPKMIQVGYGDQAKFVKSGTEGTKEMFLFNDLQLKSIEGQLEADSSKKKVTITGEDENGKAITRSLKVTDKNFNYAGLDGLKVKVWYNSDDELVSVKVLGDYTVKFDAVEIDKAKRELTTVTEDKEYDFADDVIVKGQVTKYSSLNSEYSFAKIVLDEYGDVNWIEVYNLDEELLVMNVKGNDVMGYNGDELSDADDYTIVKDGKQVSFKSLEDKDLVLYNSGEEYAAVVTNIVEGEIDRVYSEGFKFEGENYDNDGVRYISDKDLEDIDEDVLDEMKDNGKIKVYFDFTNNPVIIDGEVGEIARAYAMVSETPRLFENRGENYVTFDYINSEGTEIKTEISVSGAGANAIVDNGIVKKKDGSDITVAEFQREFVAGTVVDLSRDGSGNVTEIERAYEVKSVSGNGFDLTDSYAEGFRLQNSTLIFWNDGTSADVNKFDEYEVATLDKAKKDFNEVKKGTVYVDKNGRIVAVVATETDIDADTTWVTGIITDVRKTSDDYFITLEVNGVEKEYVGDVDDLTATLVKEDTVVNLAVTEEDIARNIATSNSAVMTLTKNATTSTLEGTIGGTSSRLTMEGKYYEKLSDGSYDRVNTSDFKSGQEITVYYREGSTKFVQVVVKGASNVIPPVGTGTVTYINTTGFMSMAIDGTTYYANAQTIVKDKNGAIVGMGSFAPIATGDQVEVKDNVATIKFTAAELAAAELTRVQAKAAARLAQTTPAGSMTVGNDTQLAAAKAAVAAVTAPALTTAEIALLSDGPTPPATTPTATAYNTAETNFTATKDAIAAYEAVVEFKRLVALFTATPTLADKANIVAARTEYGKLTTAQAGLVATEYGVLTAAEGRITALETATTEVNKALADISLVVTNGDTATVTLTATQGGTHLNVGAPVMTIETTPVPTGVSLTSPAVDITRQAEEVKVTVKVELTSSTESTIKTSKTFEITVPTTLAPPVVK